PECAPPPCEGQAGGTLAFVRGGQEGGEASWVVGWAFARFGFANRVWPAVASPESPPSLPLTRVGGVREPGLTGCQGYPKVLEPGGPPLRGVRDALPLAVADDQVARLSADGRRPPWAVAGAWEGLGDRWCSAMAGHLPAAGREDCPLGDAGVRRTKGGSIP